MDLYSEKAELAALRTICSGKDPKAAAILLSFLSVDHFNNPYIKEAVGLIKSYSKKKGEILLYSELVCDPALRESGRKFLTKKLKTVKSVSHEEVPKLRAVLEKYYKLRTLYYACTQTLESLSNESVKIDSVLDSLAESVFRARNNVNVDGMLYHFGKERNTSSLEKRVINGELPPLIPTGFKIYDEQCGGFREKSVVILSSNTGGLKSSVAKTLATNMYRNKNDVAIASFEMDEDEVAIRFMSELTEIEMRKFMEGTLSAKQKLEVANKFKEFNRWGRKNNCRFTIMSATDSDLGIDQTFAALAPFGYRVIFIDYVGLLADADSDQQWRALSTVARKSKMFAKRNNCCVVLLAQLSDDDNLRYSRGIAEHADVWWRWRITDEVRESGVFEVMQAKARHGRIFRWEMGVKFEFNKIYNLTDSAFGDNGRTTKKFKVTGDKNGKAMEEIGADEISDIYEDDLDL